MSVWPFGRRKGRRPPSSVAGLASAGGSRPASRGASSPAAAKPLGPARRPSTRSKRRRGKRRASPESDCASRSREKERVPVAPSRIDTDPEPSCATEPDILTALPVTNPLGASPHLRPANRDHADMLYDLPASPQILSASHTSLPTARERGKLQKKRRNNDPVPRRNSTKRRRDDHAREEEIRAMSTPVPVKRPAPNSGSIMRRISKKRRSARDQSDLSLPMGDSVHSSMSGGLSELLSASFKVNPLDIFAPRPTIRHSGGSGNFYTFNPVDRSTNNSRADSSMRRSPISKDVLKENKTIDDLADDMDSGTLRELMERDQRRQERKRKLDEEKLRQKLERRAEKQREKERRRERHAAEKADAILDDALGIGYESAPAEQPVASGSGAADAHEDDGSSHKVHASDPAPAKGKVEDAPMKSPATDSAFDGGRPSRFSENMSPPLSPSPAHQHRREHSYVSELPELSYEHTYSAAEPSSVSRSSSTSRRKSGEGRRGWTSFFRRRPSALRKKSSEQASPTVPSDVSFSNTSRESMGKHAFPPHVTSQPQLARKPSGTPVRTQSKFREDLPERFDKKLPISPPDSRVQSPDFASGGAAVRGFTETPDIFDSPVPPTSVGADDKTRTDSPVSMPGRSSALMSTSLASVDSEGSWLSGKPVRHSKGMRSSYGSGYGPGSARKPREEQRMSYEDLGIPDDEYFRRLTPGPDERSRTRQDGNKASSFALAEDAEAGADARQGSPAEHFHQEPLQRRPTVVHQQRHKSQEGLLGYLTTDQGSAPEVSAGAEDAADEMEGVEPTTPVFEDARETASLDESPEIHRASSIKIPKNQARLSNGSARLVDVKSARNSTDASNL
ncbi:uncharacterized protein J3D65DRAFT_316646 [Phyllosticta citribraziliensis]|uniref:Uncharacterized protein n=1 Tax=Phyllosticta citribraziliensis TaxID=989973 RepID=A0ABR1LSH9_9PEZI